VRKAFTTEDTERHREIIGFFSVSLCVLCGEIFLSGVRSMNEVFPLERAAEAYERMMSGKARFRVVLTTEA
jgi:hypothetical protein